MFNWSLSRREITHSIGVVKYTSGRKGVAFIIAISVFYYFDFEVLVLQLRKAQIVKYIF